MKLKYYLCILITLLLVQKPLMADVIAIPSYVLTSSGEVLMSAEKRLSSHHSILLWGGFGILIGIPPQPSGEVVNSGVECAVEFRKYIGSEMKKFFWGIYGGIGYMNVSAINDNLPVFNFGLKTGHKWVLFTINQQSPQIRIDIEPYVSLSIATDREYFWPNANLGLRAVLESLF